MEDSAPPFHKRKHFFPVKESKVTGSIREPSMEFPMKMKSGFSLFMSLTNLFNSSFLSKGCSGLINAGKVLSKAIKETNVSNALLRSQISLNSSITIFIQ